MNLNVLIILASLLASLTCEASIKKSLRSWTERLAACTQPFANFRQRVDLVLPKHATVEGAFSNAPLHEQLEILQALKRSLMYGIYRDNKELGNRSSVLLQLKGYQPDRPADQLLFALKWIPKLLRQLPPQSLANDEVNWQVELLLSMVFHLGGIQTTTTLDQYNKLPWTIYPEALSAIPELYDFVYEAKDHSSAAQKFIKAEIFFQSMVSLPNIMSGKFDEGVVVRDFLQTRLEAIDLVSFLAQSKLNTEDSYWYLTHTLRMFVEYLASDDDQPQIIREKAKQSLKALPDQT